MPHSAECFITLAGSLLRGVNNPKTLGPAWLRLEEWWTAQPVIWETVRTGARDACPSTSLGSALPWSCPLLHPSLSFSSPTGCSAPNLRLSSGGVVCQTTALKDSTEGFPGGSLVKNPGACQCMRRGFDPWSGKIPHSTEQLSSCTTTIEPVL